MASLFRHSRAKKRTNRPDQNRGEESLCLLVTVDLRMDLQCILGKLGLREQKVARLLVAYDPAEIARRLEISRPAVYRSIDRIRAALVEAGFGK